MNTRIKYTDKEFRKKIKKFKAESWDFDSALKNIRMICKKNNLTHKELVEINANRKIGLATKKEEKQFNTIHYELFKGHKPKDEKELAKHIKMCKHTDETAKQLAEREKIVNIRG